MKRLATTLCVAVLCLGISLGARAQETLTDVTVRDINELTSDALADLLAGGETLDLEGIYDLLPNDLAGSRIRFTGVLLTEPLLSGLRTGGNPIHGFIRDTTAASAGLDGMTIQFVDERPTGEPGTLSGDAVRGSVVTVEGTVAFFRGIVQFEVESSTVLGQYQDLGFEDSLLDPVTVTTSTLNRELGDAVQVSWEDFGDLAGQFVRLENVTVIDRTLDEDGSPQMVVTSDGGTTYVLLDHRYSTLFNNSRLTDDAYVNGGFIFRNQDNPADAPYEPPAPGSVVNLQGFIKGPDSTPGNPFEPFACCTAVPGGAWVQLAPFRAEDVEVVSEPLVRTIAVQPLTGVPGDGDVTVAAEVDADDGAVASAEVVYTVSGSTDEQTVAATLNGGVYEATIPSVDDGAFVTYQFRFTDTGAVVYTSDPAIYRVLYDGIDEIEELLLTADGEPGPSPFVGVTAPLDITATVMTAPSSGFLTVQDGDDPRSGLILEVTEDIGALNLSVGDEVNITNGTVVEIRGDLRFDRDGDNTALAEPTLTVSGTGTAYDPVVVTPDVLADEAIAEQHEGMLLRIENAVVTSNNPAGPDNNFGEFEIQAEGGTATLIVDDLADEIPGDYNVTTFAGGETISFVQGILTYAFGSYRLLPRSLADIGAITVSVDEEVTRDGFALKQSFPNPFRRSAEIAYTVGQASAVTLAVYDLLGRRVATLVDREMAPGDYRATLDATGLASGVYLYRLEAGGTSLTRTMTLVK